ncbi:hypothetical protein H4Q26_001153 [Puccinia striiformis f. sp. tritici PST-130]|nr:hypothetical protein H4Q26_001153 [Puccinia striiformis f. sp. tritici PST-130]
MFKHLNSFVMCRVNLNILVKIAFLEHVPQTELERQPAPWADAFETGSSLRIPSNEHKKCSAPMITKMADAFRVQDNWCLLTQAKMMISMAHEDLDSAPRMARTDAIDYYNQRIVLCQQEETIRLANQYLLGKIKGPCRLLTTSQTTQERGLHLTYVSTTVGLAVPDSKIQVKRGMVCESSITLGTKVTLISITVLSYCKFRGTQSQCLRSTGQRKAWM